MLPGVEPMPLEDPEPRLPGVLVLEPLDMPPLVEPLLVAPPPSEPVLPLVLPDVPPAPLVLRPWSCRQRSRSSPVSELQRAESEDVAPAEDDPLTPVDGEPMLLPVEPDGEVVLLEPEGGVVLLEPTEGELVLLSIPLAPVPPVAPVPPEVCANAADIVKSAAAVAETMSFRFISAPY